MKVLAIVLLGLAVSPAGGAMNLMLFSDPKDVAPKSFLRTSCGTKATSCKPPDLDLLEEQGFLQSQYGEDRCLLEHFFPGVCQGKYLEVGASDGVHLSSTYALFKVMGWKGVNVEFDPDNYEDLAYNRRKDIANVHAAVCSDHQTVHFAVPKNDKGVGGIWEFSSEAHRKQHWPGMTLYNTIPIKCSSLQTIIDKTVAVGKKHFFDLAVLDLEGAEYSALLGVDFDKISFGVIILERSDSGSINTQTEDLLRSKGYRVYNVASECDFLYATDLSNNTTDAPLPPPDDPNVWFIHQDFREIYSQVIKR